MDEKTLQSSAPEELLRDFASRGIAVLGPEYLGIPLEVHDKVYQQEKEAVGEQRRITPLQVPAVLELINSPGVVVACNQLVGENWAIVPFTHNATFTSGSRDQHWHKDDNGPYNARKQRHHQAVQIEMLYYPQDVREDMGPTATVPYSQYWTFNHEENHDNFAGADHLDFGYQLSGMEGQPVSGPDSKYTREEIVGRRTAHDQRMREAVTKLKWPFAEPLEAGPLRAGSVVFYSHNIFHRGNHRRDDWREWEANPRFMWRFWIYRTTDPSAVITPVEVSWQDLGVDPLTQRDLAEATDDLTAVWRYHYHWMHTGRAPAPRAEAVALSTAARKAEAERLFDQLLLPHDEAEPARVGAAYRLAAIGDDELALHLLERGLYNERESVRRAATYGLVALGPAASASFVAATSSPLKWVRKAGVYGLGDASDLSAEVLEAVSARLRDDPSVYIRAVAAGTLGCLGRRAVATGVGTSLIPQCLDALVQSLAREENRLSMDRAQERSIKFVRPTDECDVCEGGGVDFDLERFEPVRSAVRENALWSMVILSSHGAARLGDALEPAIRALQEVVDNDRNVICVGFALDALNRLAHLRPEGEEVLPSIEQLQGNMLAVLKGLPMQNWEGLVRGGLNAEVLSEFEQPD